MAGTAQRIANIAKKRLTLKGKITTLSKLLDQQKLDKTNAKLCLANLTTLFHEYETLHCELEELDSENTELATIYTSIEDDFYSVSSTVKDMPGSTLLDNSATLPGGHSTLLAKPRLPKLPVPELPTFNGNHSEWLSYRNTFTNMIDSRTDIDDFNKFMYIKNSLLGATLSPIAVYETSAENYKPAWKLLNNKYHKKRVLVSKHLNAIIDLAKITAATSDGLSRLVDDMRQHIIQLAFLGVKPDPHLTLTILEHALPKNILDEWEKTVNLQTLLLLEQFYTFIENLAYRLEQSEQAPVRQGNGFAGKRRADQSGPSKMRKNKAGARVLVINTTTATITCAKCGDNYALFKCPVYDKSTVQQHWDFAKTTSLCRNCLRTHLGKCASMNCRRCTRHHHTSLHADPESKGIPKFEPAHKPAA
ncbi:uncharacterized protein LOC106645401 [Copidosoma floridanum]|uniref:uncharacterized protein LOC106645401 n=1 Tax=Copidosoma floridanum TaxID=29053 RepID=UPI0006C94725|nr:uncharacterized protein LOC106645401 [Copidosoma floridanum]